MGCQGNKCKGSLMGTDGTNTRKVIGGTIQILQEAKEFLLEYFKENHRYKWKAQRFNLFELIYHKELYEIQ